ncbi:hypothetical protein LWI29_015506 [Acer saccharum]|uniref:Uncharacterized protein n=1 Tax=Acer saccharum TaxID=4024 RepID=A0AA39SEG1_ACESA|nr:hypothetical protein LWI29_015506 [Acer saccharum]
MKDFAEVTKEVARIAGAVMRERIAEATRGPTRSQMGPIARREKMEPTKEAMPATAMSDCVSLRSSRMMGMSGGIEKVEKKQAKSESHARWKARMWGDESENGRNSVALSSASTGREKGGFLREGGSSMDANIIFGFLELEYWRIKKCVICLRCIVSEKSFSGGSNISVSDADSM